MKTVDQIHKCCQDSYRALTGSAQCINVPPDFVAGYLCAWLETTLNAVKQLEEKGSVLDVPLDTQGDIEDTIPVEQVLPAVEFYPGEKSETPEPPPAVEDDIDPGPEIPF